MKDFGGDEKGSGRNEEMEINKMQDEMKYEIGKVQEEVDKV